MHKKAFAAALLLGLLLPANAEAQYWLVKGNDTGGMIAWSPAVEGVYRQAAAEHCAWYNKIVQITSVHRVYGDYIGFTCRFPPLYDPERARWAPFGR